MADLVEKAQAVVDIVVRDGGPHDIRFEDPRTVPALQLAQVHASLAIAEQLERLNQTLKAVSGSDYDQAQGTTTRFVRTRRA